MHRYTEVTNVINYQFGLYKLMKLYSLNYRQRPLTINKLLFTFIVHFNRVLLNYLLQKSNTVHDIKYSKTVAKSVAKCFGQSWPSSGEDVKVKFILEQAMKTQRGSRGISLYSFFNLGAR